MNGTNRRLWGLRRSASALWRARGVGRYGKYCSRRMFIVQYLAHFVSFVRKRVGSHELMTSNQYKHGAQTTLIPFTI